MTITRNPLLIICLFGLLALNACDIPSNNRMGTWGTGGTATTSTQNDQTATNTPLGKQAAQKGAQRMENQFANLPPVTVAILLPLSGSKSETGQSMLQAAQLALFDIGYTNFNLIPRDTKGTAAGAASAAQNAIDEGAQLILGPLFSDSVRAAQKVASAKDVNIIAFSTDWALADKSTFMMGFMPFSQVDRIARYSTANGYKNFALIAPRDTYGDIVAKRFEDDVSKSGGQISRSLRFKPGDPDVINQIAELKKNNDNNFQAVFMPVGGSQIETISSALSYHRLMPSQIKRIGTGLWDDPRIAQLPNMQGAWFAGPSPKSRQPFEQQYLGTYGKRPARLATLAYDATALSAILAFEGFQKSGRPAFDHQAITNPNGFSGTDGVFRFKSNGLVERALAVLELRDGRIIEIDPAPDRF